MTELLDEVRHGIRSLAKRPGSTAISLLTLAIGVGANTAIFSAVSGVLLKPLPYPDADRIVRVLEKPPGGDRNGISTLNYLDWKATNTSFEHMAATTGGSLTLSGGGLPVQLRGARVSSHYFDIFGIKATLGRTFADDEDQNGKNHVAVLSHALWASQFGSDPHLLGNAIRLDGEPYTVVGILPEGSAFDRSFPQIWTPLTFGPENMTRNFHWFGSFAKLKPTVTLEQARMQMDAIGARIARDYPDSNKGWGVVVERYGDVLVGRQLRLSLLLLLASVGLVLLIGCVNLANIALAGGLARAREVAIRAALGASRLTLVRQFLTESVLLAVAGGVLGVAVGYATLTALKAALPPNAIPPEATLTLDGQVLLFTFALSLLSGVMFGLAPALVATHPNLAAAVKEGGGHAASASGTHRRVRRVLIVAEVALAFVLLTGAGLLIRSFFQLQRLDTGFDATNVLTARLPIPRDRFPDAAPLNNYLRQITDALAAIPGVRDVALTSALPMQGWGYGMPFQIANHPTVERANRQAAFFKMVSPSYFRALGLRVRVGRGLSDRDVQGAPFVTVVNETMVRKYFPDEDPIGKRILVQQIVPGKTQLGPEIPWEVVGVVADERVTGLDARVDSPGLYVTNDQSPTPGQGVVIRAVQDTSLIQEVVQKAVFAVNKDQPVVDLKTLEQVKTESLATNRLESLLLGVFAGIAVLLAAVGIYGVISYSVVQRTQEMGIRAALGGSRAHLLGLVFREGMGLVAVGLLVGVGGSLGLTRLLTDLLFGVRPSDGLTMGAATGLLLGVAAMACYVPARRATRIPPIIALRAE
jgi:putative ABC transport system permease protein